MGSGCRADERGERPGGSNGHGGMRGGAQGEWRGGAMDGVGVRVYKSGKLSSGRWAGGALAEVLPLEAAAPAVSCADRAAAAARRAKVPQLPAAPLCDSASKFVTRMQITRHPPPPASSSDICASTPHHSGRGKRTRGCGPRRQGWAEIKAQVRQWA